MQCLNRTLVLICHGLQQHQQAISDNECILKNPSIYNVKQEVVAVTYSQSCRYFVQQSLICDFPRQNSIIQNMARRREWFYIIKETYETRYFLNYDLVPPGQLRNTPIVFILFILDFLHGNCLLMAKTRYTKRLQG